MAGDARTLADLLRLSTGAPQLSGLTWLDSPAIGVDKFADYVLYYRPNLPLAVVEAKDNSHGVGDDMQQGLG